MPVTELVVSFLCIVIPPSYWIVVGVLIITQSNPGTENYGVANTHTLIWHRLDQDLTDTLQHCFAHGHNNILSEIKWSVFWQDFAPGFEDILQDGVNCGWYNINNPLQKYIQSTSVLTRTLLTLCFRLLFWWIANPWLQVEIDKWVNFKNKSVPQAMQHKLMPCGIPHLIHLNPSHFNSLDFKVFTSPSSSLLN